MKNKPMTKDEAREQFKICTENRCRECSYEYLGFTICMERMKEKVFPIILEQLPEPAKPVRHFFDECDKDCFVCEFYSLCNNGIR